LKNDNCTVYRNSCRTFGAKINRSIKNPANRYAKIVVNFIGYGATYEPLWVKAQGGSLTPGKKEKELTCKT
jgi:hypothetical protein